MGQKLSDKYFFEGHIMKKLLSVCVLLFVCGCTGTEYMSPDHNYQLDQIHYDLQQLQWQQTFTPPTGYWY